MCLNTLNLDTHRRKWTLIINGLKGVDSHVFNACHRLSQREDAGVILCFQDLYNSVLPRPL